MNPQLLKHPAWAGRLKLASLLVVSAAILSLSGCATTDGRILDSDQSQLQLRSIQTRVL